MFWGIIMNFELYKVKDILRSLRDLGEMERFREFKIGELNAIEYELKRLPKEIKRVENMVSVIKQEKKKEVEGENSNMNFG